MSSVCGIFHRRGRAASASEVESMVEVLSHWGPDRRGTWVGSETALGHLALWTTPESMREAQPFTHASGVVVAADARIDNGDDLVRELGLPVSPGERPGDAELIAAAYAKWGDDCPSHLIGDFAFALWDPRRKALLCARDPMGLRPFYYFSAPDRFLFGTEIKAILTDEKIPRELDQLRLTLFVIAAHSEGERTHFAAVSALEPATLVVVEAERISKRLYWRLDEEREIRFARDDDYVEAFEELFQAAVDARLRSAFPVGAMLSGGLDSTTLFSFVSGSRLSGQQPLTGYTWALPPGDDWFIRDEREFADAYLAENQIDHHYVTLDSSKIFADDPQTRHLQDGLNWDLFHYGVQPTFASAAERGVRVLIFGNGGDETASYFAPDYLLNLALRLRPALLAEVRAQAQMHETSARRVCQERVLRPLIEAARGRAALTFERDHENLLAKVRQPDESGIVLSEAAIRETGVAEYLDGRRPRFSHPWRHPVRCDQIYRLNGRSTFASLACFKWNTSVLHHIECRYPFLDRRILEYCVALPPEQHRQGGWSRRLLRRSAAPRIPRKIAWRTTKTHTFPDYMRGIARSEPELRQRFERWGRSRAITPYLDVRRLDRHLDAVLADCAAGHGPRGRDTSSFCRAVLLGLYLDPDSG